jgi:diphthamide biosynthesis protein 7
VRKLSTPLTQADVGGGAWRVKWHPSAARKNDLLVACMHDGFKIVRFDLDGHLDSPNGCEVIKRFDAHESLAYAVDWSLAEHDTVETLIASGSFYDHALHLWGG